MKPEIILKKVIEKAVKNGYVVPDRFTSLTPWQAVQTPMFYYPIIFSHDFCKAFWGEETHANFYSKENPKSNNKCRFCGSRCTWYGVSKVKYEFVPKCYQYHLQQLAILPDNKRINYLKNFL